MDGRHSSGGKKIVLQVKHYASSNFHALKRAMKEERRSIDTLGPSRYILATSRSLTHGNKAVLAREIGPSLSNESDIFGQEDLEGLLRKFPNILRSHIKLWLSSTEVLDKVLRAAAHHFTTITRDEIETKVRVYAPNPSFNEARDKLEAEHVIIISGPPGVGKTTLAEMLSYAYSSEDWEFVAIRSLDDGFAAIVDARKQIFFFDDFLGRAALDARALAAHDSDLARFIRRVRKSTNARFVLTTRAPIFEEARRISEHLADRRLDIAKYVLDVGIYTRRIRARILYNHLLVAGTPQPLIKALWDAGALPKIVDHRNYNPRIIEHMTDAVHANDIEPDAYPSAFLGALEKPSQIWDIAFRNHIAPRCRHLLLALFFGSEYGIEIDDLRAPFNALHGYFCQKFGIAHDAKDFEEALKILEGGFLEIRGKRISFVNPSLRDYLIAYLEDDFDLLKDIATTLVRGVWAENLWTYVSETRPLSSGKQEQLAKALLPLAEQFLLIPIWRRDSQNPSTLQRNDLCNSERLELLLQWHAVSDDALFIDLAIRLVDKPVGGGFNSWRDGPALVRIIGRLRYGDCDSVVRMEELAERLEAAVIDILDYPLDPDDFDRLLDAIEESERFFKTNIKEVVERTIERHINEVESNLDSMDSEEMLQDYMKVMNRYAPMVGATPQKLQEIAKSIERRIAAINEDVDEAPAPEVVERREPDKFDNVALANLFAPLVAN